jgi:hypothetical protein
MMRRVKIIVEKGVVVGGGSSYEEALDDVRSAIRLRIDTFGADVLPDAPKSRVMAAFHALRLSRDAEPLDHQSFDFENHPDAFMRNPDVPFDAEMPRPPSI